MDIINYDNLYEDAVVDFSNHLGLKPFPQIENAQEFEELTGNSPQQYDVDTHYNNIQRDTQSSTKEEPPKKSKENYSKFSGFEQFNRLYDKVQAYNRDAARYRDILTKIASIESSFRPQVVNSIGAAGYFQFIDSTRNNVMRKLGKPTSKQYFLNNPEVQILAAIELAKEFEKSFSPQEIETAKQRGHTLSGLISGAWLGGAQGVKRYLKTGKDSSDGNTTISKRIKIGDSV